jgi:PAS domain S-box-containing protein
MGGSSYSNSGIAENIARSRKAGETLREQASLLDKARDAILVLDPAHRILYWNRSAERFYGWMAAEVLGRPIGELIHCDSSGFLEAAGTTLAEGEWVGEIKQVTRTGKTLLVESR